MVCCHLSATSTGSWLPRLQRRTNGCSPGQPEETGHTILDPTFAAAVASPPLTGWTDPDPQGPVQCSPVACRPHARYPVVLAGTILFDSQWTRTSFLLDWVYAGLGVSIQTYFCFIHTRWIWVGGIKAHSRNREITFSFWCATRKFVFYQMMITLCAIYPGFLQSRYQWLVYKNPTQARARCHVSVTFLTASRISR